MTTTLANCMNMTGTAISPSGALVPASTPNVRMNDGAPGFIVTKSIVPINDLPPKSPDGFVTTPPVSTPASTDSSTPAPTSAGLFTMPQSTTEWAGVAVGAVGLSLAARKLLNTGPVTTIASVIVGALAGKFVASKI